MNLDKKTTIMIFVEDRNKLYSLQKPDEGNIALTLHRILENLVNGI